MDFSGVEFGAVTDTDNMFRGQAGLTSVNGTFGNLLNSADGMFMNCLSLTEIPNLYFSGDSINISRICGCSAGQGSVGNIMLRRAVYANNCVITSMDYAFTNQPNIESIYLYDFDINLTSAPTSAFAGCSALSSVTVKENEHILTALQTDLPDKK